MTPDLDAIRQRLGEDRERYAIGASGMDDRHNLLALVDRQQARIAAIEAFRPNLESAIRQMQQTADDWAAIVTLPTLQEGQRNLIQLLRDLLAALDGGEG